MDQEQLFDAEPERMEQDDFGEGPPGAPGFDPPGQPFRRETVIDGLVERLHHPLQGPNDGLADGRPHDGCNGIGDDMGVSADGTGQGRLDMRGECSGQTVIFFPAQRDRFHQDFADCRRVCRGMVDPIAEFGKLRLFGGQQECAEFSPLFFEMGESGWISSGRLVGGPWRIHRHTLLLIMTLRLLSAIL